MQVAFGDIAKAPRPLLLELISQMRRVCVICRTFFDAQSADAVACVAGGLRLGSDKTFARCRFALPLRGSDCRPARYAVIIRARLPLRHEHFVFRQIRKMHAKRHPIARHGSRFFMARAHGHAACSAMSASAPDCIRAQCAVVEEFKKTGGCVDMKATEIESISRTYQTSRL